MKELKSFLGLNKTQPTQTHRTQQKEAHSKPMGHMEAYSKKQHRESKKLSASSLRNPLIKLTKLHREKIQMNKN